MAICATPAIIKAIPVHVTMVIPPMTGLVKMKNEKIPIRMANKRYSHQLGSNKDLSSSEKLARLIDLNRSQKPTNNGKIAIVI